MDPERQFDMNNPAGYSGNVLLIAHSILSDLDADSAALEIWAWEHDAQGECGQANGAPAADTTIGNLIIMGVGFGLPLLLGKPWEGDTETSLKIITTALGALSVLGIGQALVSGGNDDFIGVLRPKCVSEEQFSAGSYNVIDSNTTTVRGHVTLVNNTTNDDGWACPLTSATIGGPANVENVNGQGSPHPVYIANVVGGIGPTDQLRWKDNGAIRSTSSSYTISPLTVGSHLLEFRIIRRDDTLTTQRSIDVTEGSGCPPLGCD